MVDRPLRGSRRLDRPGREPRPRGGADDPVRLLRAPACGARATRRHGREVHRRRRDGGVRRPGCARGRSRARRSRGARDPRALAESAFDVRIAVHTGEALVALGARVAAGEAMVAGDVVNTAARLQTAAPVNGVLVGESTYRATEHAIRYGRAIEVHAKGKSEPVPAWEALEREGACRRGRRARPTRGARRPGGRGRAAHGRARAGTTGARAAARHARRGSRDGQEPARRGAPVGRRGAARADHLAPGSLPAVWGEHQLLGARRDGEGTGRCARVGLGAGRGRQARGRCRDPRAGRGRRGLGARHMCGRSSGSAPRSVPTTAASEAFAAWRRFFEALAERRPGARLRGPPLGRRRSARLRRPSRRVGRGVPLLVVASARPELLERRPGWGGGKANALDRVAEPAVRRADRTPPRAAPRPGGRSTPSADDAARPRRREPALRGGVRAHAARRPLRGRAPRDRAGHHRGPARRAVGGREGPDPGRGRDRQGVLVGHARRDRRRRPGRCRATGSTSSNGRSSSAATVAAPSRPRASTRSGTCSCATSRTPQIPRSRRRGPASACGRVDR